MFVSEMAPVENGKDFRIRKIWRQRMARDIVEA